LTARTLRLGVSGGIGSGKSTVCQMLEHQGACVIDADAISRASTAAGGSAIAAIQAAFGPDFLDANGAMDRTLMRQLVFSQPQARAQLEAIVHPLVAMEVERQTHKAITFGVRCIVFDIPLLVESRHWRKNLDRVLIVDCSTPTQITRVMQRNGLSTSEVENIIQAQSTRQQRLQAADFVIFNEDKNLFEIKRELESLGLQFGL
jgi:dephospho-CoA kinase